MFSTLVQHIIIHPVIQARNLRSIVDSSLFLYPIHSNGWIILKSMPMSPFLLPVQSSLFLIWTLQQSSHHSPWPPVLAPQSPPPTLSDHATLLSMVLLLVPIIVFTNGTSTTTITPCPLPRGLDTAYLSHLLLHAILALIWRNS